MESFLEAFLFSGQSGRSFTYCIRTKLQGKLLFFVEVLIEDMGKVERPSVNSWAMIVQLCHCSVQEGTKSIYSSGLLVKQLLIQNFFWRPQHIIQQVPPTGLPPFLRHFSNERFCSNRVVQSWPWRPKSSLVKLWATRIKIVIKVHMRSRQFFLEEERAQV